MTRIAWNKGKTRETDSRISRPWLGKKRSKETIDRIRQTKAGSKHTEETRAKMSVSQRQRPKSGVYKKCVVCGKVIYVKKCLIKRKKYCSRLCMGKDRIAKMLEWYSKNKRVVWNRGKKLSRSHIEKLRISHTGYVATEEQRRKMSEAHKGERSYLWRGGVSFFPHPPEFNNALKRRIRERDSFKCQECGYTEKQLGRKLCVHHIDYDKTNSDPSNLISLCLSCHAQTNFKREDWKKYYQNKVINSTAL